MNPARPPGTTAPTGSTGRRKARWSTVEEIKDYIREHGLRPGDPLPTENELCEELGVSRSSVREAMRTLSSLDIVEVRHGHGSFVGGLSMSPLVSGLVFRGSLNRDGTFRTLREVVQVRIALDMAVAEELVSTYRGTTNEDLRELVGRMRRRSEAGETFVEEDGEFHRALLSQLDNTVVRQLVGAFWEVHTSVVPMLGIATSAEIATTVEAHGEMIDALEAGDVPAYHEAVLRHYAPLQHAIEQGLAETEDGTHD
ncbi:FadR/GntR family transcriptional regulator [Ornithinimicrobium avium]|uniref:FadR family transcriptional regulator n=1 Tax=Ornithinimicrobium avium TaxID=2283195 RepID=A0A345NMH9_9MICO|nr:FadR/GntR family transcriptional regulator [Ornithinimicrobium avium]AXH96237.1 FadR family transcriptional regulator [Ornithinimicrobium avium]